ncbi:MAG: DUF615 domain-containing protein [Desulfobacteraceae bacterium]|nr:DUF615 domain-containing protein [Desulfobacteraceae bacterium]MBC2754468.1 DUF615 domain-containing protein [Desulfobacteraceae bacterium]
MDDDRKSKTQIKNEVKALQKVGEQLVKLSSDQLDRIDLPEALSAAVKDARQITRHEARRRQMQYIGKLMRKIDPAPILKSLRNIRQGDYQKAIAIKKIETWRDELKEGNVEIIEEIINSCPNAERQRLNQLARNTRNSRETAKASNASKALFRYLKEIYDS